MSLERNREWLDLEERITTCHKCERLVAWRDTIAHVRKKAYQDWDYWGKPVPGFGDPESRILAVGLAPGAHGSNRTGRMFTGDSSGNFLYRVLHHTGFANQPDSTRMGDGLTLDDLYISAVCRCVPPQNKPLPAEINNCRSFLEEEVALLGNLRVVVALGRIAFDQILGVFSRITDKHQKFPFIHGKWYELQGCSIRLIASYHPSRQNTQTGRLTEAMFTEIWVRARQSLE
jgi:uracil-DNA glycosylase family 4